MGGGGLLRVDSVVYRGPESVFGAAFSQLVCLCPCTDA